MKYVIESIDDLPLAGGIFAKFTLNRHLKFTNTRCFERLPGANGGKDYLRS